MQAVRRVFFLGVAAVGLALCPLAALAKTVTLTVDGVTYTLTAPPLSYTNNAAVLQAQPWWGNQALAFAISTQLGYQLGDLDGGSSQTIPSALVAYGTDAGFVSITYDFEGTIFNCQTGCPSVDNTYAYVTVVPAANVPTLSQWGLALMAALLGVTGILAARALRPV